MKVQRVLAVVLVSICASFCSCKKAYITGGTPDCLKNIVDEIQLMNCPGTAKIEEYKFESEHVYLIIPGVCSTDLAYRIVDRNCKTIGKIGGWYSNQVNGKNFRKSSRLISVVWER